MRLDLTDLRTLIETRNEVGISCELILSHDAHELFVAQAVAAGEPTDSFCGAQVVRADFDGALWALRVQR